MTAPIGHNSQAGNDLKAIVASIENLAEQKSALGEDITAKYADAKSRGFDTKVLRRVVALRKLEKSVREEQASLEETYMHALGMLD